MSLLDSSVVVSTHVTVLLSATIDQKHAGEKKGLGAYSEYTLADDRISFKLPTSISREAASTVPLAAGTAWLALFSKDCLNIDRKRGNQNTVLVWGGSCTSSMSPWKRLQD